MEQEMILDEEIVENYSLDGVYEEIQTFAEMSPNLMQKVHNMLFLKSIKEYFQFMTE